jgi:hypothetical protein
MKTPCVVAFGGGTNSAAMLIEMQSGELFQTLFSLLILVASFQRLMSLSIHLANG